MDSGNHPAAAGAAVGYAGLSFEALGLAKAAISSNTRRTYTAPVNRFRTWRRSLGQQEDAEHISSADVCNFFASLLKEGLAFSSIRIYRSALSTWWVERMLELGVQRPNPTQDDSVSRVLKGLEKTLLPMKLKRAAAASAPVAMTPELIERLRPVLWGASPHAMMRFAAITTGTYALLRPGELLGSAQHRDRALRAEQITFHASALPSPVGLLANGVTTDEYAMPDHFTIAPLGVTKADPLAHNGPIDVAGAPAVRALWEWMHLRRDMAPEEGDSLFQVPQHKALSCSEIVSALVDAVELTDGTRPNITGKCFRKGGASGLLAAGSARPDIAAQGRWRNVAMVETYASAMAKQARALAVSRSMAPPKALPGSSEQLRRSS